MGHRLEFDSLPSMGAGYLSVLKPGGKSGEEVPRIEAKVDDVVVDRKAAEEYDDVCGLPHAPVVAPTFLHVLAAPLHLQIISHDAFPFKALGLVHVRNTIKAYKPIERGSVVNIEAFVEGKEEARSGYEFDLVTCVHQGGELVWEESTVVLHRTKTSKSDDKKKRKRHDTPHPGLDGDDILRSTPWNVPADMGRQYAGVSGDYNPIHLFSLTAKAFGFKRQIVHGMWSQARVLGDLVDDLDIFAPLELEIAFKKPLTLPARPVLTTREAGEGIDYELRKADQEKLFLEGNATPIV